MEYINWDLVQALVQVVGFGGVVWGLVENRRALQTQVAMEFYRRFADISARMPNELRLAAHGAKAYGDLPEAIRVESVRSLIDYLNLSSEEFSLYTKGRLPTDAWEEAARRTTILDLKPKIGTGHSMARETLMLARQIDRFSTSIGAGTSLHA
jgi:hypothetical protein